jgi:hypothetical protein
MIATFVSGFTEKVDDGSPIWAIADRVEILEGVEQVSRRTWQDDLVKSITDPPVEGPKPKRLVVVYSYGCADLFRAIAAAERLGLTVRIDFLVIIVGVPRWADGQFQPDCWVIPDSVRSCICFSTDSSVFPACSPIRNPSAKWLNYSVAWQGVDHSNVVALPVVMETVLDAAARLVSAERKPVPAAAPPASV